MSANFVKLFSPFDLGHVTLRNRIVSPPHGTHYAADGLVTKRQIAYYEARARGGTGMIVAGHWSAWPRTTSTTRSNWATDPGAAAGHVELAKAVHEHGTVLTAQLHVGGRLGGPPLAGGPMLAPSPIPDQRTRIVPKEMNEAEIRDMVRSFGVAAESMQQAGWDGVELLAAQGIGLGQFISPQSNIRADAYGGSTAGRLRAVLEILDEIRSRVGEDFLVGVRVNASDWIPGGLELEESTSVAKMLEDSGRVSYLSLTGGGSENYPVWITDMGHVDGPFVSQSQHFKSQVDLPLIVVTRIMDPAFAEKVLESGAADLVGMNRALIADPELPKKAMQGRVSSIRPCIGCNQGCLGSAIMGGPVRCTVNPKTGRESDAQFIGVPATRQSVLVVGGGPAGLQAAVRAAEAGCTVTLVDENAQLGGQLRLAAKTGSRSDLALIVDYLERSARELGVEIQTDRHLQRDDIGDGQFDSVIFATGSVPVRGGFSSHRPSAKVIPGWDLGHVATVHEILSGSVPVGSRAVVVDDDPHGQAVNVAEFLAEAGAAVTLVSWAPNVGQPYGPANMFPVYRRLFGASVNVLEHTWVDSIDTESVWCSNVYSGAPVELHGIDQVVMATGNAVRDDLYREVIASFQSTRVIRVGDCVAPRMLDDAIGDGYAVPALLASEVRG